MFKSSQIYNQQIDHLSIQAKLLITTINAHCYNMAQSDVDYKDALLNSDVLLPDGVSVAWAIKWLTGQKIKKIAGADLFYYEIGRLQQSSGKCFFLGSTDTTITKIKERLAKEYPNIIVQGYSPPYKTEFSENDNNDMIELINSFQPDVLFIGMTAPKQEKWAYQHFNNLQVGHICCIGAVFDFYSGTVNRAPQWMIKLGLEWFFRLIKEPRRMWRRYLIGNTKFIWHIFKEKIKDKRRFQGRNQKSTSQKLRIILNNSADVINIIEKDDKEHGNRPTHIRPCKKELTDLTQANQSATHLEQSDRNSADCFLITDEGLHRQLEWQYLKEEKSPNLMNPGTLNRIQSTY